ncbi:hypothetical protein AK830_g1289 [Neonectria ditissima]|uniref:Uncharacterized protein n=1 Tax=Neonectria ditissima TaxID=78410 RepID=A0A0P7B6E6_9HYPO|nr:hypothetical protein AK830_g1289 [Neonectria ditissima]
MTTIIKLPPEVLREILRHVHDGIERHRYARRYPPPDRFELKGIDFRENLCSLRSVNRVFHKLVTPLLFQHALITSGSGVLRLQQLSKSPLRRLVRRLEICVEVHPVADFDLYETKLEENKDRNLMYLGRLAIAIHSAFPRFTGLKILKLDFVDIPYNFDLETDHVLSTVCMSGCRWEQDTANLFESFATAMRRSQLDDLDEVDLSLPLAFDFGHFLDENNDEDDNDGDAKKYSMKAFFQRLKSLRLHCGRSTDDGEDTEFRFRQPNEEYDKYIRQLLPLAPNINSLKLMGSDFFRLDQSAFAPLHLRSLMLSSLSTTGDAFTALVQQSTALEEVILEGVYLESGMWKDIFWAMSQSSITSLYVEFCGYHWDGESAHFRPPNPGSRRSDSYIETTEVEDLDAYKAVFARVRANKRRLFGSNYDEAADVESTPFPR